MLIWLRHGEARLTTKWPDLSEPTTKAGQKHNIFLGEFPPKQSKE